MKRFLALSGLCIPILTASIAGTATARVAATAESAAAREAARPGDYCSFSSCRPRAASPLTGAAFGVVVLGIGWQARHRRAREA